MIKHLKITYKDMTKRSALRKWLGPSRSWKQVNRITLIPVSTTGTTYRKHTYVRCDFWGSWVMGTSDLSVLLLQAPCESNYTYIFLNEESFY